MSAAVDSARKRCSCGNSRLQNFSTKCKNLKCSCFRDGLHCILGRCKCKGCENNPNGLAIDVLPMKCSCKSSRCKTSVCTCFREKSLCTGLCKCVGCENKSERRAYQGGKGCKCKRNKCKSKKCGCLERGARCTLKCSCQGCENGKGTGGEAADKSNAGAGEQGQVTPEVRAEAADKSNAGAGEQEKQPISPMLEQKQPTSDTGGSGSMSSGKAIEPSSKRTKLSSDEIAEHDANLPSL